MRRCFAFMFVIGLGGVILSAQSRTEAPIVPFRIAVPDRVLTDLKVRLDNTRLPSRIDGSGWDYGTDLSYMSELLG